MTVQIQYPFPSLSEVFTITATCQPCVDQAVKCLQDVEEIVEFAGSNGALHSIRGISTDIAEIRNSAGNPVNGTRNYDCV